MIVAVFGQQKSASRQFADALAQLPDDAHYPRQWLRLPVAGKRFELTDIELPDKGVIHIQSRPTSHNLDVLVSHKIPCFVTMRHPGDLAAAMTCHYRRRGRPGMTVGELLQDPKYEKELEWIADWLSAVESTDGLQSKVVQYERLIDIPADVLQECAQFTLGRQSERIKAAKRRLEPGRMQTIRDKDRKIYPHGWTGRVGIARKYFSDEDADLYKRIVGKFLDNYPASGHLLAYYPRMREPFVA